MLKTQPQTLFSRAITRWKTFGSCVRQQVIITMGQKHIGHEDWDIPACLDLRFKSHRDQTNHILVLVGWYPSCITPQQIRFHLIVWMQGSCELIQTCTAAGFMKIFQEVGLPPCQEWWKKGRLLPEQMNPHINDWLVVSMCPSWKMMEFVNGKDDIPYMKWKIKAMFQTTNINDFLSFLRLAPTGSQP